MEVEAEVEIEEELIPEPEPVIELLDLGDPEIVIEESGSSEKAEEGESIFELEEEAEAAEAASASLEPVESIFELEDEPKEDVESATPAPDAGFFELDEEVEFEAAEEQDIEQSETPQIPGSNRNSFREYFRAGRGRGRREGRYLPASARRGRDTGTGLRDRRRGSSARHL